MIVAVAGSTGAKIGDGAACRCRFSVCSFAWLLLFVGLVGFVGVTVAVVVAVGAAEELVFMLDGLK